MEIYSLKKYVSILCIACCSGLTFAGDVDVKTKTFKYRGVVYTYEQAMLMKSPPPGFQIVKDDTECKKNLEGIVDISERALELIHLSEDGYNGMAKSWPTKREGVFTWDTGKYSINSINWPRFEGQLTPFDLRWNDCASLVAAAFVFNEFYQEAKEKFKQDVVAGVPPMEALQDILHTLAGYNSKTPSVRKRYADRLTIMLGRFLFEGEDTALWAKS